MTDFMQKISGAFTEMGDKVSEVVEEVNPVEGMSAKEKKSMAENLDMALLGVLTVTAVAVPLLISPITADWFDIPKQSLVLVGVALGILTFLARGILGKKLVFARSIFDLPILAFLAVSFASALLSPNRNMALTADVSLLLGAVGMYFLAGTILDSEKKVVSLVKFILAGAGIISIWSVVQVVYSFLAVSLKLNINFLPLATGFSLTGSILSQAMLLVICLPVGYGAYKIARGTEKKIFQGLLSITGIGLVMTLYILYRSQPILLPFEMGWKIAAGVMGQSFQAALLGVGGGNFIDAFTSFKPMEINGTALWNSRFITSSNYYFYVLATAGIGGLAAFIYLVSQVLMAAKKRLTAKIINDFEKGIIASLVLIIAGAVVLPLPGIILVYFLIFLGVFVALAKINEVNVIAHENERLLAEPAGKILAIIALAVVLGIPAYYQGRALVADYFYNQSLVAARANRGSDTYNLQIQAINMNPDNDAYHVAYAQTNLLLATNLASQKELTDQQKQMVVTLVQQAVREGQAGVALAPNRAGNYEVLSLIYRNLINFAQGADQQAITMEQRAINLEPVSPRLRLDLGGIYLTLKDFASAGQLFAQAVNLKGDYANAHYNLAQAMKELKMKDQAAQQLQVTASLVCQANPNGDDCKKVNAEITELGVNNANQSATPAKKEESSLATSAAQVNPNLQKAKVSPAPKVSSPSGEVMR